MKYKIQIQKIWETADGANPEAPKPFTGLNIVLMENGGSYTIYAPGHNLKQNEIKKAIKDHIKTLPVRPELEGTTIDVDTEEED